MEAPCGAFEERRYEPVDGSQEEDGASQSCQVICSYHAESQGGGHPAQEEVEHPEVDSPVFLRRVQDAEPPGASGSQVHGAQVAVVVIQVGEQKAAEPHFG